METPILETERLILKPLSLEDAPAIQKYFNNWNIIRHLSIVVPWPYPEDGAETFIRDIALPMVEAGKAHVWSIRIKGEADEAVGIVHYRSEPTAEGHRGFWLAEPYWGNGYMTEAVEAVQDFLFFELAIPVLKITNHKTNPASRRIKEKTGARFLHINILPHREGTTIEAEIWEIRQEDWAAIRER